MSLLTTIHSLTFSPLPHLPCQVGGLGDVVLGLARTSFMAALHQYYTRTALPLNIQSLTHPLAPISPISPPLPTPHTQVGGLGDVVHGLARTSLARGHNVTVLMPFYECLPQDQIEALGFEMEIDVPKGYVWDGVMQVRHVVFLNMS